MKRENYQTPITEVIEMELEGSILDGSGAFPPIGDGGDII